MAPPSAEQTGPGATHNARSGTISASHPQSTDANGLLSLVKHGEKVYPHSCARGDTPPTAWCRELQNHWLADSTERRSDESA